MNYEAIWKKWAGAIGTQPLNIKFTNDWRDCVHIQDVTLTDDQICYMSFMPEDGKASSSYRLNLRSSRLACNLTEDEVEWRLHNLFMQFETLYRANLVSHVENSYSDYHYKIQEYYSDKADFHRLISAGSRVAHVSRRGRGNVFFNNNVMMYVGKNKYDAGIIVGKKHDKFGIFTLNDKHTWLDYGVRMR